MAVRALLAAAACLVGLVIALALAVRHVEALGRLDQRLQQAVDLLRTAWLVELFAWITGFGATPTLLVAAAGASLALLARRHRRECLSLWVAALGTQASVWLLKLLTERPRPLLPTEIAAVSPSFPSGHAANALAVYGMLAFLAGRTTGRAAARAQIRLGSALLIALIALIALSRVFLGVHYASDVVAGLLLGGAWLLGAIGLCERPHRTRQVGGERRGTG